MRSLKDNRSMLDAALSNIPINTKKTTIINVKAITGIFPRKPNGVIIQFVSLHGNHLEIDANIVINIEIKPHTTTLKYNTVDLCALIRMLIIKEPTDESCKDAISWEHYLNSYVLPFIDATIYDWAGNRYPNSNLSNPITELFYGVDGILNGNMNYASVQARATRKLVELEAVNPEYIVSLISSYEGPALSIMYEPIE
ncbi:MAG: hypothetical protein LBI18_03690 [Planctomycetaceae bacterium]|nr:hypothetical protein [Planctomycetaceae bacterium]